MSNVSVTSSKREMITSDLMQELDSIRSLNSSLRSYLQHVQLFKQNILTMTENYDRLCEVNVEWVKTLKTIK